MVRVLCCQGIMHYMFPYNCEEFSCFRIDATKIKEQMKAACSSSAPGRIQTNFCKRLGIRNETHFFKTEVLTTYQTTRTVYTCPSYWFVSTESCVCYGCFQQGLPFFWCQLALKTFTCMLTCRSTLFVAKTGGGIKMIRS